MHRFYFLILPFLLIIVGVSIFFYLTSEPLSEKQFTHKGKQFSILAPRTFQYKDTGEAAIWGKGEDILNISLTLVEKKPTKIITCNDFKASGTGTYYAEAETAFIANIKSLKKSFEVCRTPDPNFPGYVVLDTLGLEENDTRYLLGINAKEDFIKTKKGQEKVKKIIESFEVK